MNLFKNLLLITTNIILSSYFTINSLAAGSCKDIEKNPNSSPAEIAACGSPQELSAKLGSGTSLYDIIMLINTSLLIVVAFFSIIGTIIGVINLAKAQSNKSAFEEARGTITNSLLAFLIAVSVWIIVRLVFNTLGIGTISPTPTP